MLRSVRAPRRSSHSPYRWVTGCVLLGVAAAGYVAVTSSHDGMPGVLVPAAAAAPAAPAAPEAPKLSKKEKQAQLEARERETFFSNDGPIPTLHVDFEPREWEYLRKDARRYAEGTMWEDGSARLWKGVAIKCKGSAGSFQAPDQRPGLSFSNNKYKGGERWHGFLKWHLNNGQQDATYLQEQISCEIARAAGVPASRCSHAFLNLQGRDLGLYVVKEAFDEDFLAHFFKDPTGDLYDGGFVQDLNEGMEKDEGDPKQRDNLKELIAAAKEPDQAKRWERLPKILDLDRYFSFIALESIVCHWDGYNFNKNNYRVYFDAESGKACFFLHGTDQTFGDANFPITQTGGTMICQAVVSNPEWKKAYHDRVEKIYREVLLPIDWPARVTEVGQKVKAALAARDPQKAKEYETRIGEVRTRVANRIAGIGKQLGEQPKPIVFDAKSFASLGGDGWRTEGAAAAIDTAVRDGKECLHLRADGESVASWRKTVTLPPGKYRFEGRVATAGLVPTKSPSGEGAGLRISGGSRDAANAASGETAWKDVAFTFETPGGDVVLVAESRASKGETWFPRESLKLSQVK